MSVWEVLCLGVCASTGVEALGLKQGTKRIMDRVEAPAIFLCGIAAPLCTLPTEQSKTRTQDSLWRGESLRFFFGPVAAPACTLPNKSIQRQGHNAALGGNARDFFLDYFSS